MRSGSGASSGYAGKLVTWAAGTLQIVKRPGNLHTFTVLPRRWVFERTFGWIMKYRRCDRDYERLPQHHENYLYWSMITVMGRRARPPPQTRRPRLRYPSQHEVPKQALSLFFNLSG